MPYGDKPFGLRDIKLTDITGVTQVDLPVAQRLAFNIRTKSGELSGDDTIAAVVSFAEAIEWELEAGGISLEAWAIMMGETATISGSTPSATDTLQLSGGQALPYFKIYGKSLGEGDDDVHVKMAKCKLTDTIEGELADGEFYVVSCSGIAVPDGSNILIEIVQNETAATLPTS